jgi:hypothetical protein
MHHRVKPSSTFPRLDQAGNTLEKEGYLEKKEEEGFQIELS